MHPEAIDQNAGFLARSLRALGRERLRTATAVLSSLLCLISAGAAYALSPIQEAMSRTIESLTPPPMLGGEGLTDIDLITDFYMRREFQPAWTTPAKVDEMMSLIAGSSGHGLIPEDYHWSRLQQLVAQYRATSNPEGALVVELDILLTDALARLGYHLRFGKVDLAVHEGLRECGDVDNGVAMCEFADGRMACFYASRTMAHGHETATEIVGTEGRLVVGRDGRRNQVEIADGHGIRTLTTPTFYERFADAFLREEIHFIDAIRFNRPLALSLHDATEATRIGIALRTSLLERRVVEL